MSEKTDTQTNDIAPKAVGDIGNYYGGLNVKSEGGRFFWSVENYDGDHWDEIPAYLFGALLRFEDERHTPSSEQATS